MTSVLVVEDDPDDYQIPTVGVLVGDDFYYIRANSAQLANERPNVADGEAASNRWSGGSRSGRSAVLMPLMPSGAISATR